MPTQTLFQLPKNLSAPKRIRLYETPPPIRSTDAINALAKKFGVAGQSKDCGTRYVISNDRGEVEIFAASESLRWSLAEPDAPPQVPRATLPDADRLEEIATAYIREHGQPDGKAEMHGITYVELSIDDRGKRSTGRTHAQVNYRFTLDTLRVFGPGAKMQVTINTEGAVTRFLSFWRPVRAGGVRAVIDPKVALRTFTESELFADLRARAAKVAILEIGLGYYALPPRELQRVLIPVYRIVGIVSTRTLPEYRFTRYQVAVAYSADEVKALGVVHGDPRPLI